MTHESIVLTYIYLYTLFYQSLVGILCASYVISNRYWPIDVVFLDVNVCLLFLTALMSKIGR